MSLDKPSAEETADAAASERERRKALNASCEAWLGSALAAYRDEYRELAEAWRHLDTKAQTTVTMAGIFLGGVFAAARVQDSRTPVVERGGLVLSSVSLLLAVLFAGLTLRIRRSPGPPSATEIERAVNDVIKAAGAAADGDRCAELQRALLGEQVKAWRQSLAGLRSEFSEKAAAVRLAQGFLLAGVVVAGGMTVLTILQIRL